jgi:hypothetical protein
MALGRNWLFADTVKGAKASAALYSIVSTARANGLEPLRVPAPTVRRIAESQNRKDFEALLPFNTAPHSQLPLTRNTAIFRSRT